MRLSGGGHDRDRTGPGLRRATTGATVLALSLFAPGPLAVPAQTLPEARDAFRTGRYEEAVAGYRALARGSGGTEVWRGLVEVLSTVGRYDDAEAAARDGLTRGHDPELLVPLAEVLTLRGERDEAEEVLRAAIEAGARDRLTAELRLALLLQRRGLRDEARRRFDRFIDYYNEGRARTADDLLAVARAVQELGATDPQLFRDALRAYDEAGALDPTSHEAPLRVGALFLEKYNSADARSSFREVLAVNPRHPRALLGIARVMDFDAEPGALEQAEKALEVNERLVPARVFLAEIHLGLEDHQEALEQVRLALEVDPGSLEALSVLAASHYLQGDSAGYREARDRVLALNPRYAELFHVVADRAVQHRKYREAVELARRAVELDDRHWRARGLLGINQLRIGRIEDGTSNLEAAFEGDPYNVWFKNTLDLLDTFSRYETVETEHFRVVLDRRESELLAPYVADLAEEAWDALVRRYGYEPPHPVRVELFPNHADFSVRTVGLAGMGALGVSFGPVLVMDSPSARSQGEFNWASTLWHEISHSFHLGLSRHEVPRWFTEGLSVLEQRRGREGWGHQPSPAYLLAYRQDRMPPVSRLNQGFVRPEFPEQVPFSYLHASLVCEFIEERHGFPALLAILRGYGEGESSEEVLGRVLSTSMDRLDRDFDDWFRERFAAPLGALPLPGEDGGAGRAALAGRDADPESLRTAARRRPGEFRAQLAAGAALFRAGRLDEAEPYLERAKSLFPQYGAPDSPYVFLARIHRRRGDLPRAEAELEAQLRRGESDWEAHLELAEVRRELGDTTGAAAVLRRALEIWPFDAGIHERLAGLHEAVEDWDGAVRERGAVVALEPVDMADALYRLARALHGAGRPDEARSTVLRALERAPNFREAQDLLLELRAAGEEGA